MPSSYENQWMRRVKKLTQALLFSIALNIGLLASFAYIAFKEKHQIVAYAPKAAIKETALEAESNVSVLRAYSQLPFQELLLKLENTELVEEGLSKRDLALSCLVVFHNFNLERALGGLVLQKRLLPFPSADGQESMDLAVFPGLADYQFQAILQYAKTEKWPFTSQGLFYEIKRTSAQIDTSLLEAFYLAPEFHMIQMLFVRTGIAISKEHLVQLVAEGEWKTLKEFTEAQKDLADFTPDRRRALLVEYFNGGSKIAARVLLETDLEFSLKRLDDAQSVAMLEMCPEKFLELELFAKGLLNSPRADPVWKKAAQSLYVFVGEAMPEPYDHQAVLRRFLPEALPPVQQEVAAPVSEKQAPVAASSSEKKKQIHVIEAGDSLWKISRKYHVSVEELKKANHLETEKLRLGKQLEIPDRSEKTAR